MKRLLSLILCLCLLLGATASLADTLMIDLSAATDEELAEAAAKIKAEQKSRLKAHIVIDPEDVTVNKGAGQKLAAAAADLDDGVTAGKFAWITEDPAIAVCNNNTVKGVAAGETKVICTTTLSDGTELEAEIPVTVVVPVNKIVLAANKMEVMNGDTFLPEVTVLPEDTTNKEVTWASSDEAVVKWDEESSQLKAVGMGKAVVTVTAADGSNKANKCTVTVTRKVGKYDDELTFQGLAWDSDAEACYDRLKEVGLVNADDRAYAYNSSWFRYWPVNDLLFASSTWDDVDVVFSDRGTGLAYCSPSLQKKVGGYEPNSFSLYFLNGLKDDTVDSEATRLSGVYIHYDNQHEPGQEIFTSLLAKLEEQYGEFTKYIAKDFSRYKNYKEIYNAIAASMEGATVYNYKTLKKEFPDAYLSDYAICVLKGKNNTGILLMISTYGEVTLFYGKTDTLDRIAELQAALEAIPSDKEDAGL